MKIRKILPLPTLALALSLAYAPRAQAIVYTWNTDTQSAFDVTISGTGLWTGKLDSPSGLWDVGAHAWFASNYPFPGECSISNGGDRTTYMGAINGFNQPYESLQGYADDFSMSGPVHDGTTFTESSSPKLLWLGSASITVTSMPNPNDVSTWTWTEEVSAHVVPEPGALSLSLVGFGFLAFRKFARRRN